MASSTRTRRRLSATAVAWAFVALAAVSARPGEAQTPPLDQVPVPLPPNLDTYVLSRPAAIALGKALFWDMQVGSDGVQACATCHFHAGVDNRVKNQVNPNLAGGDATFQVVPGPNSTVTAAAFPFHQRQAPADRQRRVLRDSNDVMSSQGVRLAQFVDIVPGSPVDASSPLADPVFNIGGVNVRRVEPRNAPSTNNVIFNLNNFWDGRASDVFNGRNPFGPRDPAAHVLVNDAAGLTRQLARLPLASLASLATGPALSDFEMSFVGRTWPKVGKKLLSLTPLSGQQVHPQDSVLGALSNTPNPGLNQSYATMVQAAFRPEFWNNATQVVTFDPAGEPTLLPNPGGALSTSQFTQMEANFSLFFGLAIMMYQSTLVSGQTAFDRFVAGDPNALTEEQQAGLELFEGPGRCANCHGGAVFTLAVSNPVAVGLADEGLMDFMPRGRGGRAFYDTGFFNTAVTLTANDIGRADRAPFINPLTGQPYPLGFSAMGVLKFQGLLPPDVAAFAPDAPLDVLVVLRAVRAQAALARAVAGGNVRRIARAQARLDTANARLTAAVNSEGNFKAPSLRNIELTGPYMHNGGMSTLMQVVEFYTRGGNFPRENAFNRDPDIRVLPRLRRADAKAQLVAFMLALTDERVRQEQAPFDHPELFVPVGSPDGNPAVDDFIVVPAVGNAGRPGQGLPALQTFLNLDPQSP